MYAAINNIYKKGELFRSSTVREYLTVQMKGARRGQGDV